MFKEEISEFYPEMINNLPEADISFPGVRGKLFQGENNQIVFFEIEPIGVVPNHSHCAQWGFVLDGEMEFTIDGITKTYKKGDSYFIGDGVVHSALFKKKTWVIDVFADKNRYLPK